MHGGSGGHDCSGCYAIGEAGTEAVRVSSVRCRTVTSDGFLYFSTRKSQDDWRHEHIQDLSQVHGAEEDCAHWMRRSQTDSRWLRSLTTQTASRSRPQSHLC